MRNNCFIPPHCEAKDKICALLIYFPDKNVSEFDKNIGFGLGNKMKKAVGMGGGRRRRRRKTRRKHKSHKKHKSHRRKSHRHKSHKKRHTRRRRRRRR